MFIAATCLLFFTRTAKAEENEGQGKSIVLDVEGKLYENVKIGDEFIIGNKSIEDVDVKVISVDGHALKNVGTKSGVLDDQGRTVLEFSSNATGKGIWNVRIFYHAADDPVKENQPYEFEVTGLVFKASEDASEEKPEVKKPTGVSVVGGSKCAVVKWSKLDKNADGVQIQYAWKKSQYSDKNMVIALKQDLNIRINKLKSKRTNYVRVCAYKNWTDGLGNDVVIQSKWVEKKVVIK